MIPEEVITKKLEFLKLRRIPENPVYYLALGSTGGPIDPSGTGKFAYKTFGSLKTQIIDTFMSGYTGGKLTRSEATDLFKKLVSDGTLVIKTL